MIKVYIASPYTIGDVAMNVKLQIDTANELMDLGLAPFVPLLSHFQHLVHPRVYDDWIKLDLEWITVCDYVLRIGGISEGADKEVKFAEKRGIPVYCSIEELMKQVKYV